MKRRFKTSIVLVFFSFLTETASADEIRITDLQKDIQNLYNYNVMLMEKLVNAQSMLHVLSEKKSS